MEENRKKRTIEEDRTNFGYTLEEILKSNDDFFDAFLDDSHSYESLVDVSFCDKIDADVYLADLNDKFLEVYNLYWINYDDIARSTHTVNDNSVLCQRLINSFHIFVGKQIRMYDDIEMFTPKGRCFGDIYHSIKITVASVDLKSTINAYVALYKDVFSVYEVNKHYYALFEKQMKNAFCLYLSVWLSSESVKTGRKSMNMFRFDYVSVCRKALSMDSEMHDIYPNVAGLMKHKENGLLQDDFFTRITLIVRNLKEHMPWVDSSYDGLEPIRYFYSYEDDGLNGLQLSRLYINDLYVPDGVLDEMEWELLYLYIYGFGLQIPMFVEEHLTGKKIRLPWTDKCCLTAYFAEHCRGRIYEVKLKDMFLNGDKKDMTRSVSMYLRMFTLFLGCANKVKRDRLYHMSYAVDSLSSLVETMSSLCVEFCGSVTKGFEYVKSLNVTNYGLLEVYQHCVDVDYNIRMSAKDINSNVGRAIVASDADFEIWYVENFGKEYNPVLM